MLGTLSIRRAVRASAALVFVSSLLAIQAPAALAASTIAFHVGPISLISTCAGQNAEVEQAVDRSLGYIYETWMGCRGIAFTRSTDGGRTFDSPTYVPGSTGSNSNSWDPAVAVAPNGTVYAAFMLARNSQWYPVVAASFDHGQTFPQVSPLIPPDQKNWGDRDFIAVAPNGEVYLTWDYGPNRSSVTNICSASGSCAFATGDLNAVFQKSVDGGKTWSAMTHVSPGFPASGGDSAPMVVEPSGRIDVLYQGYHITNTTTYAMDPAYSYFTASNDHGATWSTPVRLGSTGDTMSLAEWWIDGALAADAAGNLYASWDTQGATLDTGWLSVSTDHGSTWSAPLQVAQTSSNDPSNTPNLMEVTGGGSGVAYVGWLTNGSGAYIQYLRPYSISKGWLTAPIRISTQLGDTSVWPGDTFGLSTLSANRVALSWGSAIPVNNQLRSEIFATVIDFATH